MLFEQIAGECCGDLLVAVESHVQSEVHAGHSGDFANVVMYWIAFDDSPRGFRIADSRCVVKGHDGVESRQSRGNHFGTAAEACEEMRLDETGRDFEVAFDPCTIQ